MEGPRAPLGVVALAAAALTGVVALAGIVLAVIARDQDGRVALMLGSLAGAIAAAIGALIVRRRSNTVGWVMFGIGAALAFSDFGTEYGIVAATGTIDLPAWQWLVQIGLLMLVLAACGIFLLFLLFPTGRLPGPRWRIVLVGGLTSGLSVTVLRFLDPGQVTITESAAVVFANPAGVQALAGVNQRLLPAAGLLALVSGLACITSLVVRFRQGGRDDRERIKWLAYVAVSSFAFLFLGELASSAAGCEESCGNAVWNVFFAGIALGVPAAVGLAVLRHGLYDIEIVIRKTVVVAALAAFFVLVYALVVGGIGALVQASSNTALSFAAAALVAVLSQPVLARVRRFADVVVYGRRATPYEVLADFSGAMAGTRASEAVLDEMARVAGEGAGAAQAQVWLRLGQSVRLAATWAAQPGARAAPPVTELALAGSQLPQLPAEVTVPVRQDGELLGALALTMTASEPATPVTRKLVADLAGQAGLVLRNVQLIEELRASRRRLVTAQDEERRKLERNLHDGAQQQLIALRIRLRIAEATLQDDPESIGPALAELGEAAQSALDDLRDLARGIYPPLLADRGLAVALEAQARKSPIDVQVQADGVTRYPQDVEAAVYFCSLEALQNVAKYAGASSATIRLYRDGDLLAFAVTDDGAGFDPAHTGYGTGLQGMADRLSALGGKIGVRSAPGSGTTITGMLPVPSHPNPNLNQRGDR